MRYDELCVLIGCRTRRHFPRLILARMTASTRVTFQCSSSELALRREGGRKDAVFIIIFNRF